MTYNLLDDLKHNYIGRKIELIYTDDTYTNLKSGDKGIIKYVFQNLDDICIQVEWESGSSLSLIYGKDDFKVLD